MGNDSPIGIFDSGVGGLSVLRSICDQLPGEQILYVGDQTHVPYGSRSEEEVQEYSRGITNWLLEKKAKIIVVACNTASAAALDDLRRTYRNVPFVGMEPAIKPAAELTKSGVVGVLATPATFQGKLYKSVLERFANGVVVLQDACPGLVGQIEKGDLDSIETELILQRALLPMLEKGIDTVVLGCTHYPFVIPQIKRIVGPGVRVIDPAPAVARQVGRLLNDVTDTKSFPGEAIVSYYTTARADSMRMLLPKFMGITGNVNELHWQNGELIE